MAEYFINPIFTKNGENNFVCKYELSDNTTAKHVFLLAIVSLLKLSTSQEVNIVYLARDSKPMRLLEIPMSLSLYILISLKLVNQYLFCSTAYLHCTHNQS